jgi:guanylate kinase
MRGASLQPPSSTGRLKRESPGEPLSELEPGEHAADLRMTTVFIISAPSGSGKSTLVSRLLASDPGLRFSVSYTTRAPRGLEKPGESYVYITREEFRRRIDLGEFLEHAEVFGNYYGTHVEVLDRAQAEGKDLILDIDVNGARQLKERIPEAVSIFILPPSRDILEQRLRSRSEDSEEVIRRRLSDAAEEIRNYKQYDYVLVNHQVEESTATLWSIIRAERVRRVRMEPRIRPILKSFEERSPLLFK